MASSRRRFLKQSAMAAAALSGRWLPKLAGQADGDAPRLKLALAGDTMLGRGVAETLRRVPAPTLFSADVVDAVREADLFILNLECCISTRGAPWPAVGKPFFFRAPPAAVETLLHLGVDCVTLANNHALDFGFDALLDTFEHLAAAGIQWVGAGEDLRRARAPVNLGTPDFRLTVLAVTDHPRDFAAGEDRPGVAYADLAAGVPEWLAEQVTAGAHDAHAVLLTPHWGPNMTAEPPAYVRAAARRLREQATFVAGHSAHVFHGVEANVLYDMGDFIDDYARDDVMRNDLGLLYLLTLDQAGPIRLEGVPLKLEYCHTRLASGADATWIARRFEAACAALGTRVAEEHGRLVIAFR